MYGYIYKFTFLPTGDFYIGQHKYENQNDLDESYWGSGKKWNKLIQQYPKSEWHNLIKREIIEWAESPCLLSILEFYWVDKLKAIEKGANLTPGGGYFPVLVGEANGMFGKHHSEETKYKLSEAAKQGYINGTRICDFKGCTKENNERLKKISDSLMGHNVSVDTRAKLSNYFKDRIIVTNGKESINILPEQLPEYEAKGYWRGLTKKDKRKKVAVTNSEGTIYILEEELESYLAKGYEHKGATAGRPSWNAGKKCPQLGHNQKGENNGNYGKYKYTNGIDSIRCKPGDEPEGYYSMNEWRKMQKCLYKK